MKLKEARKKNNLTQTEVAKKLNIDYTTIGRYENGITEPNIETLKQLAKLYNTTVDSLIDNDVPYLLDKSLLSQEQNEIIDQIINLTREQCMLVSAYIEGLKIGQTKRDNVIKKLKGE